MALRVMFDTNAYDAILAAGDAAAIRALSEAGKIAVILTPIQEAEIRQTRNATKRRRLLAVLRAIGGQMIEPASVIDADITYMARDEMLARVAAKHCDLLVTGDTALSKAATAASYGAFVRRSGLRG